MKYGISYIALLAGAAFALSVGAAQAQTPLGTDPTGPLVLENLNGVIVPSGTSGVYTPNKFTPTTTTWASEASATTYAPTTAPTIPSLSVVNGTYASGDYLVQGGALVAGTSFPTTCATATPCTWVSPTSADPAKSFQWVPATYQSAAGFSTAVSTPVGSLGTGQTGAYLVNTATGAFQTPTVGTNYVSGTGAAASGFAWVSANTTDPKLFSSANTIYQTSGFATINTITSPVGPNGITSSVSYVPGGAIATNSNGQVSTFGPGGVAVSDKSGNTTTVTASSVTTTTVNTGTVNAAAVSAGYVGADVLATQDSAGHVYGNVGDTLTSQQGQITALSAYTNKEVKLLSSGIAVASAFEAPQVDPGHKFGVSLNWGEFNSQSAFSGVGKFRFSDNWSATAGVGVSTTGYVAAKAGIQTQW